MEVWIGVMLVMVAVIFVVGWATMRDEDDSDDFTW